MQTNRKVVLLTSNPKPSLELDFANIQQIDPRLTWGRTTTGTVVDVVEGKLNTCKVNEARFTGRRVENLNTNSKLSGTATVPTTWTAQFSTGTTNVVASSVWQDHYSLQQVVAAQRTSFYKSFTCVIGNSYRFSFTIEAISGVSGTPGVFTIESGASASTVTVNSSTVPCRYSSVAFTATATAVVIRFGIGCNGNATGNVTLSAPLLENVTGQANQNSSDYVSTGILAYPYHGCGVDGVKCLATTNGNTVSSFVVTEAPGTPLTGITLLCEGELRTNLLLFSATPATQDITTTAQSYTISMWGTGTCTLTGTATGTLTGTSATTREKLTITATEGTLTLTFAGTNTNGQAEAGASMSSYIPTAGVAVTRQPDVPSFTGAGLTWYNATQGTFVIEAAGEAFKAPSDLGALSLTYASKTKYALSYNNSAKNGSTYLYTAATVSSPTEYTGVSVPTTIYVNAAGIVNISRFTYYPKALKPSKMAALL